MQDRSLRKKNPFLLTIQYILATQTGAEPVSYTHLDVYKRQAENGKEVTVLVELRARFDEENNIEWSRRLEYAGCNVIYGLPGYKVHSKLCLVTRKHHDEIQYLTQVGTGNYNEKTAELYTDLMVMTANPQIGENARQVFQAVSYTHLVYIPIDKIEMHVRPLKTKKELEKIFCIEPEEQLICYRNQQKRMDIQNQDLYKRQVQ